MIKMIQMVTALQTVVIRAPMMLKMMSTMTVSVVM